MSFVDPSVDGNGTMDYSDIESFFGGPGYGEEDEYDIKTDYVTLCDKTEVIRFGAQILPAFYCTIFLLSLLGNGLVLYIIYMYEKLGTVTNIFLLNLVISDLVFALSLPFWATYHSSEWIFGVALCKLVGAVYFLGFYSSMLFLMLLTFDRYLAVVHAVPAAKSRKKAYALGSSVVVWCVSFLATVKEFFLYNVQDMENYKKICEETGFSKDVLSKWQLVGYYQQFLLFFLLPLLVVLYCYMRITLRIIHTRMREKCRALKLIFVIIVTFFMCWTPYNVVILLRAIRLGGAADSCDTGLDYALYVTRNIAYLYCCVNPVFYTFVGKKFQNHLVKMLSKHFPSLKDHVLASQSSRTTSFRSPTTVHEY
ncbi:chemokine (C-C motif) receptor 12a [Scleropages formosus]|uniref:Chemokine (C-C motif) receptor 12a n=1 Tax=Scleropages formosus TaxID=113540 RepID=A0A8C9WKP6_SCLFO|nr:C-C chemokine receptor type 3-like [Scleropages formosus]